MRSEINSSENLIIDEAHLVEALFKHASLGILITDLDGNILVTNPFILALFGYQADELSGKPVELLIPERARTRHIKHRQHFHTHMQNRPMGTGMDLFALRKSGSEFPVEVSLCHYTNNNTTFVIAFINDITIRKQNEQEILNLYEQLEKKVEERTLQLNNALKEIEKKSREIASALEKEKALNELKSRFLSIASHEFRTPLSTILSSAYLLKQYRNTDEQINRERHIEKITASVTSLTEILNDFLSVGKIEAGKILVKRTTFDASEFLRTLVEQVKPMLKKGQTISSFHSGNSTIFTDVTLLKHILLNLLTNATKFSPEDSEIVVAGHITKEKATFSVCDTGIGIPKEDQPYLFSRFFRAGNAAHIQGTGLGLNIVAEYTALINGSIVCESEQNKGTTMTLTLPLMTPPLIP